MTTAAKSERIQLRISPEAKMQILKAASVSQQDTTSFILEAATSRARSVLLESALLELPEADLRRIEEALTSGNSVSEKLLHAVRSAHRIGRN